MVHISKLKPKSIAARAIPMVFLALHEDVKTNCIKPVPSASNMIHRWTDRKSSSECM